jgi:hypothetical protein
VLVEFSMSGLYVVFRIWVMLLDQKPKYKFFYVSEQDNIQGFDVIQYWVNLLHWLSLGMLMELVAQPMELINKLDDPCT